MSKTKQQQPAATAQTDSATPATTTETKPKTSRLTEQELVAKYPHVRVGSLVFSAAENKQTCEADLPCGHTRRLATSDLWQVRACPTCHKKAQADRRKAKRAERKAAKAAQAQAA